MLTGTLGVLLLLTGLIGGYLLRTKEAKLLAEIKPELSTIKNMMAGKVTLVENDFLTAYRKVSTLLGKL